MCVCIYTHTVCGFTLLAQCLVNGSLPSVDASQRCSYKDLVSTVCYKHKYVEYIYGHFEACNSVFLCSMSSVYVVFVYVCRNGKSLDSGVHEGSAESTSSALTAAL